MAGQEITGATIFFTWLAERVSKPQLEMFRTAYDELEKYGAEHGLLTASERGAPVKLAEIKSAAMLGRLMRVASSDPETKWTQSKFQMNKLQALIVHLMNFATDTPSSLQNAKTPAVTAPKPEPKISSAPEWTNEFGTWLSAQNTPSDVIVMMLKACIEVEDCLSKNGVALLTTHVTEANAFVLEIAQRILNESPLIHSKYSRESIYRMQTVMKLLLKRAQSGV